MWSFTPESHPAHPAAIKREVIERDGMVYIDMNALCQAEKRECDALIEQFKEINGKIRESMQAGT